MHALNFFVAAMQTGFGPFVSVWLVSRGWSLTDVGIALSVGTVAALCAQLPGGALVDMVHHKRPITGAALAVVAVSALMIGLAPSVTVVRAAQMLHGVGSAVITPAIAALTLALCGPDSFSERLGGNARYASLGAALAAGAFGLASTHLGQQSIFLITAALALPATVSLLAIRSLLLADIGGSHGDRRSQGSRYPAMDPVPRSRDAHLRPVRHSVPPE